MKAQVIYKNGDVEKFKYTEVSDPEIKPHEVLIQTEAAGINFIDIYHRRGDYKTKLPNVLGLEASGVIVSVGKEVTQYKVGDRVTCASGKGCYAEKFAADSADIHKIPLSMPFEIAAALPLQGLTAHYLANSYHVEAQDTAIIHAGAGGVALLLTQLLTEKGVKVISTVGSKKKQEISLSAGAYASVLYEELEDFLAKKNLTKSAKIVYDGVGKNTIKTSLAQCAIRGTVVLFGASSGAVEPFDLQELNRQGSLSITRPSLWHFMRNEQEKSWRYNEIIRAWETGKLKINIDSIYSLTQVSKAHKRLESRSSSGKIIIIP